MALNELEQIKVVLRNSKHILLVFSAPPSIDSLASAMALRRFLMVLGAQVDVACDQFIPPKNTGFLPGVEAVKPELAHLQKFTIKVNVSKTHLETISYDIKDGWLSIHLTPKNGSITKNELRTAQTSFKYDCIVALGASDLESLGGIFANNSDLFYRTPVINVDHQGHNERYGQINYIDLTATSTAELIYRLVKDMDEARLDGALATTLLAGIIGATKSFKVPEVTPQTLAVASDLIERGAERDTVVRHLYRTKTLAALKLWGLALNHLQHDTARGLVWTAISKEDFERSGAGAADLSGITEELISNSPAAKAVLLIYEDTGQPATVHGFITSEKEYDVMALAKPLRPEGSRKQATFTLRGKTMTQAQEEMLAIITGAIGKRPATG